MLLTNFYLHHLSIFLPDTNPLPLLFAPFLLFFFSIILSTFRYFPTFLSQFLHSFLLHSILYINLFFSIFPLLLHPSSPLPHSSFLPFFLLFSFSSLFLFSVLSFSCFLSTFSFNFILFHLLYFILLSLAFSLPLLFLPPLSSLSSFFILYS